MTQSICNDAVRALVFRDAAPETDVSDVAPTSQAWILQYADSGSGPRTTEITFGSNGSLQAPSAMDSPFVMRR